MITLTLNVHEDYTRTLRGTVEYEDDIIVGFADDMDTLEEKMKTLLNERYYLHPDEVILKNHFI